MQTLTQCQKSFLFLQQLTAADQQHKSCVNYAQIMQRLCTNQAQCVTLAHSVIKIKNMQSLSITVISISLSINKGDVPRVYVPQTVFWKRQKQCFSIFVTKNNGGKKQWFSIFVAKKIMLQYFCGKKQCFSIFVAKNNASVFVWQKTMLQHFCRKKQCFSIWVAKNDGSVFLWQETMVQYFVRLFL